MVLTQPLCDNWTIFACKLTRRTFSRCWFFHQKSWLLAHNMPAGMQHFVDVNQMKNLWIQDLHKENYIQAWCFKLADIKLVMGWIAHWWGPQECFEKPFYRSRVIFDVKSFTRGHVMHWDVRKVFKNVSTPARTMLFKNTTTAFLACQLATIAGFSFPAKCATKST